MRPLLGSGEVPLKVFILEVEVGGAEVQLSAALVAAIGTFREAVEFAFERLVQSTSTLQIQFFFSKNKRLG